MKCTTGFVLIFLLGAMFVSLFHMSTGMDMTGRSSHCPFMAETGVLCPTNLADHIEAWTSVFVAVVPTMALLLIVAGAIALAVSTVPLLFAPRFSPIPIRSWYVKERTYTYSSRPLQDLFADGVLHPKVF